MKSIFRSRLPPPLTSAQINTITKQSHLEIEDIQEWYERFNHCYPRGYLSLKEFINYLQQLNIAKKNDNHPTKSMMKQLFRILDLNEDKQLNFEEFFLFILFINQGSVKEKLKLILNLYDRNKTKYLTREQLENVLNNMFDLLNIPKPPNGLSKTIETILTRANFNKQETKISWHTFSTYIVNDPSLFQLLISGDNNDDLTDDEPDLLITRF
jgi:Ca2+-binding EF-hand superfamily protein